tara:strand:+ start:2101 stop:2343 length:243 start_codon:yes stop_codon:yes gene_type:complete
MACYSNLDLYGVNGRVHGIRAPVPVEIKPKLFQLLGQGHADDLVRAQPEIEKARGNCVPYANMDQYDVPSGYNKMFCSKR